MDLLSAPQLPFDSQDNCELFEKLPGEVRDRIYTFALSYYDDPDQLVCLLITPPIDYGSCQP